MVELPQGREYLPILFRENGYKVGAEIGVEQGVYTEQLATFGGKLYAIDAWQAYKGYRDHVSQSKLDGFYEITKERVKDLNVEVIKGYSMDVVEQFKDNSLDFVYIDGNHNFKNVAMDLCEWYEKVRIGGIVSGHDFIRKKGVDFAVKDVVPAFVYHKGINNLAVLRGDRSPSWYFVKHG